MNQDQFTQWIAIQERQAVALEKIARLLQQQLPRPPAPEYEAILENFPNFNWASMGAECVQRDNYGVSVVCWRGNLYQRRSPENAYGTAIYFSRGIGKDEQGRNLYERLITFKPASSINVRPISRDAEAYIKK